MVKVYCDKCGKELLWPGNLTLNDMNASIGDTAQNFNSDGYKTFDPGSRQMLDLCNECKYRMFAQTYNREYKAVGRSEFADFSFGLKPKEGERCD